MMNILRLFNLKYYLLMLMPLLLVACDNSNPPAPVPPVPPVELTSIQLSVDETSSLPQGYMRQYNAIGIYSDNSKNDITSTVTWASSTANVTITAAGVATAESVGSSEIFASAADISSPSITLTVTDAVATDLVIERIQANIVLPFNRYEQLHAYVVFSDNVVLNVTKYADWTSSMTGIITINNTSGSPLIGEVLAVANTGNSVITATDPVDSANMAMLTVNVSNAALTELIIDPTTGIELVSDPATEVSLPKGVLQEYSAQGLFDDGNTRDIHKSRIDWKHNESDGIVEFVEDAILSAEKVGSTNFTAVDKATLKFKELPVTVTDAELVAIVTVPVGGLPGGDVLLPNGRNVEYSAYAVYTDSNEDSDFLNITDNTTFTSSDTSIALPISSRIFKGKALGKVTITALERSTGMQASPVNLEVTSAVLEAMTMSPLALPAPMDVDDTKQLAVTGAFSDGTSKDITKAAQWSSSDSSVVVVSNLEETRGEIRAVGSGSALITAADSDSGKSTTIVIDVN